MHDERRSSNFANFNGINRNIQLRFCIEYQAKVTYIYRNTRKNQLRFLSAWSVGDVGGMVLEEFQNIMLSIYICRISFLNGLQKSTDRIFRLAVPALLAASGHIL